MNPLLLVAATGVAGVLIATPTVAGLSGNTSFTRDIRVPVPSGAQHVEPSDLSEATPTSVPPTGSRHEHHTHPEDRPGHDVAPSDLTDDHGGLRTDNSGSGGGSSGSDDHGADGRSGRSGGGDG